MRKIIITAITAATLITIASGTAAYTALGQAHLDAPTAHHLSAHVGHDGRLKRPGPATLLAY